MINIQKFYSLYIGYIQSYSVCFGSIQSTLVIFGPHWPYSVYFISIWSTLILFGPFCSLWSTSIGSFSPLWSYLVHSINFGSIWSTLVLFVHFNPIQSNLVIFGPICSYLVHYVHFVLICPFVLIRFYSIHIGPIQFTMVHCLIRSTSVLCCPIWSTLFPFGFILCIRSTMFHLIQFDPFVSTLVPSNHFNPIWSILVNFCVLTYGEKACLD